MKRNYFLFLSVVSVLFVSCKKGDTGATGPAGSTGNQGPSGPASTPYASPWIKVDSSMWTHTAADSSTFDATYYDHSFLLKNGTDTAIDFHAAVPMPKLTQKVLDSGHVYFYFKDSTDPQVIVYPWGPDYELSVGVSNYSSIPQSYYIDAKSGLSTGSMSIQTTWIGRSNYTNTDSRNYDFRQPNYKQTPPKTKFYIRYLVLQGSLSGGRLATIDYKNYKEVQKAYNLND